MSFSAVKTYYFSRTVFIFATVIWLLMTMIVYNFYEYDEDPYQAGYSALVVPIFNHIEGLEALITVLWKKQSCDTLEYENIIHLTLGTAITISSVLGSKIMIKNMQQANK